MKMNVLPRLNSIGRLNCRSISISSITLLKERNPLVYAFKASNDKNEREKIIQIGKDKKILFSTFLNQYAVPVSKQKSVASALLKADQNNIVTRSVPITVKIDNLEHHDNEVPSKAKSYNESYPFLNVDSFEYSEEKSFFTPDESTVTLEDEMKKRLDTYQPYKNIMDNVTDPKISQIYHNTPITDPEFLELHKIGYGVPNSSIPSSHINCKGCGAPLHCQNESLPGYIPSEPFITTTNRQKSKLVCQRCYFLKYHNMALSVRVDPSEYNRLLEAISNSKCLALVVVDLFDIPCSIWPGIVDLLGRRRPVIVVANKVDLLPPDGPDHLVYVEKALRECINQTSLGKTNIKAVKMVSAKTGYGIEDLVTLIQKSWRTKGNIYIVGTTNSGKSTLFNTLMGSDLCQSSASVLMGRATSSLWPGTTLNMLKFPLMKMSVEKSIVRQKRLETEKSMKYNNNYKAIESMSGYTREFDAATLKGSLSHTYTHHFKSHYMPNLIETKRVPNEEWKEKAGKWCCDTPGTIQSDQIITLLTHDELVKAVPTTILEPRTFCLQTGLTLFIGGIARMDVLYCSSYVRLTVYSSKALPITLVNTVDASEVYRNHLQTGLFEVPCGSEKRFEKWPALKGHNFFVTGLGGDQCCCDIVLASCGFISPTAEYDAEIDLRAWTPDGRGIYLRKNSILPRTVTLRGRRRQGSFDYGSHTTYLPEFESDNAHHIVHATQ